MTNLIIESFYQAGNAMTSCCSSDSVISPRSTCSDPSTYCSSTGPPFEFSYFSHGGRRFLVLSFDLQTSSGRGSVHSSTNKLLASSLVDFSPFAFGFGMTRTNGERVNAQVLHKKVQHLHSDEQGEVIPGANLLERSMK